MLNIKSSLVIIGILFFTFLFIWVFLVKAVAPDAGHEAVLLHQPIIFGKGGVDNNSVKPGRKYVWFSTYYYEVNVQPVQYPVHFDDLMSLDGVPLDFDSVIRLRVKDPVKLIKVFGPDWYEKNVKAEFRNRVRQSVRKHGMNETAISSVAIDQIDAEVSKDIQDYITKAGLPIELLDVTVGKANPPDAIKNQRIETASQQQRILSEQQRKLAEDQRKLAEQSRASADNAYRQAMNLSPDQFLKLENIKMMRDVCAKGNCTFLTGTDSVVPTYSTNK